MSLTLPSSVPTLPNLPIMMNRQAYDDACALLAEYGDEAGLEAGERANAARSIGNHIHYCHWRQIERMLCLLAIEACMGTVH